MSLLSVRNLTVAVKEVHTHKKLIDEISFEVPKEKIVALVGGSGSGKTTTGLSILRLLAKGLLIQKGNIFFEEKDLLRISEKEMRAFRGNEIAMVFQEPLDAFNPVFSIGFQIKEVLQAHTELSVQQRDKRALELLDLVGLKEPKRVLESYPHQLSGGMRQRAMIAQAVAAKPKLLLADEPTSNLDVTLQAKIMELFRQLRKEFSLSILLITHDLGMVKHLADQVVVMAKGHIVESGETQDVLQKPQHEYTHRLMKALDV